MENTFERFDEYRIRRLQQGERIESFDCGDADLNDFIINESHKSYFLVDNKTGCRFVTVDAYIGAVPFYEHNDFQHLKGHDEDLITRLLFYDLNDMEI